jgi:hypothetical protein
VDGLQEPKWMGCRGLRGALAIEWWMRHSSQTPASSLGPCRSVWGSKGQPTFDCVSPCGSVSARGHGCAVVCTQRTFGRCPVVDMWVLAGGGMLGVQHLRRASLWMGVGGVGAVPGLHVQCGSVLTGLCG